MFISRKTNIFYLGPGGNEVCPLRASLEVDTWQATRTYQFGDPDCMSPLDSIIELPACCAAY